MKKILSLKNEKSSFQWWESMRIYFNIVALILSVFITAISYIINPAQVNFFYFGLVFFYLVGLNVFYFSGFILEYLIGASELHSLKRKISLIYFILINIMTLFVSLGVFIIPIL